MPESERDEQPDLPTTFGKYFLTEKLATGGMAEIYLAKIVGPGGFEKQLVIKQIHPKLSGQRHFVDLFVAEAKTLVTLTHGNIVPVYELGVIDDTYFIAMEYIDGPTLYRLTEALARREVQMEPALAAWITARVLEGLDYAHRKGEGVIHRDLSPRNVMLSRDGEVKLVDFGIAVARGEGGEGGEGAAPTGSFPYMSPEQVRKEALTGQTDLFSVGVLLWEMLVGHRLFARNDPDATLHAVVDDDIPRPSAERRDIPAPLERVVMRALERDMTERWPSAGEMLAALQRYLYSLPRTPGPRDVEALVARYCPPETRRLPTDLIVELPVEPKIHDTDVGPSPEAPRPGPRTAVIPRPGTPPPGTAVVARDGAAPGTAAFARDAAAPATFARDGAAPGTAAFARDGAAAADAHAGTARAATDPDAVSRDERDPTPVVPRGKRRARTETFATNVQLEHILERATPLFPIQAIRDDADTPTRDDRDATPRRPRPGDDDAEPAGERPSTNGHAHPRPDRLPFDMPGKEPPSRALLGIAAILAAVLGAAAIVVFMRGRAAVLRVDAAPRTDVAAYMMGFEGGVPDAPPDGLDDASIDAPALPIDAGHHVPLGKDAGELLPKIDAAPRPVGTATLKIGANPWGDVVVDGVRKGRTPMDALSVSAGKHAIEVIFGGEDPPRTQRFTVDLANGETKDVFADFTKP